jgi:hypothetical protein
MADNIIRYMNTHPYRNLVNWYWYQNLKYNLHQLFKNYVIINLTELNNYIYERYLYEHNLDQNLLENFDNDKYNYEQIFIELNINTINNINYDADNELDINMDIDIDNTNYITNITNKLQQVTI